MEALDPDNPKDISREDRMAAMTYLMFLKEKRDFTINSQEFCDGRVHRN